MKANVRPRPRWPTAYSPGRVVSIDLLSSPELEGMGRHGCGTSSPGCGSTGRPPLALPFLSATVEIDTGGVKDALVIPAEALAVVGRPAVAATSSGPRAGAAAHHHSPRKRRPARSVRGPERGRAGGLAVERGRPGSPGREKAWRGGRLARRDGDRLEITGESGTLGMRRRGGARRSEHGFGSTRPASLLDSLVSLDTASAAPGSAGRARPGTGR